MILSTTPGFGKLLAAGWMGISAGVLALADVVRADGFEWKVISLLLALVGVLLLAAWNDLKKRDDDARADRRDLYQRLNTLDKEVARLQSRQDQQNHQSRDHR